MIDEQTPAAGPLTAESAKLLRQGVQEQAAEHVVPKLDEGGFPLHYEAVSARP